MSVAETYANNASSTLNGSIDGSQGSLVVNSATRFPPSPQFRVYIDTELLLVTGVSSNTFTVTRGVEGTTAAAHADGATVTQVLSSGGLVGVAGSISLSGVVANLPAAGVVGRTYLPDNGFGIYQDTGNAWSVFGPVSRIVPPDDSLFSWVNQVSGTISSTNGAPFLRVNATGVDGVHARVKSIPSAPYTITMGFVPMQLFADFSTLGLALRESGTGKILTMGIVANTFYQSGGGTQTRRGIQVETWGSPTSGGATYGTSPAGVFATDWSCGPCMWFQISDDSTNLKFRISNDGVNFQQIFSVANHSFLTADQYGFFVRNFTTSYDVGILVLSLTAG